MDILKAELFFPQREENKETTETAKIMAVEVADCIVTELRDPKKVTSSYLSDLDGEFSWGNTSDKEHILGMGMMTTTDPAENPFAALTQQLHNFGRMIRKHASAVGHARLHGDFDLNWEPGRVDGLYHQLSDQMRWSLMEFALSTSSEVRKSKLEALERQREEKQRRQETL